MSVEALALTLDQCRNFYMSSTIFKLKAKLGIHVILQSYSNPILASSPIPQSASLAVCGLSSSLLFALKLLPLLLLPLLLILPALKLELLLSKLLMLSAYSGGGKFSFSVWERGCCMTSAFVLVRLGVVAGVTSVLGVISTSSASRYHFRRRV